MEKCIYCGNPNDLTDSHIVPECLGSKLKLLGSVCQDCNSTIGRTIEAQLCDDFSFYRLIAQIKTKKGKLATTKADLELFGKRVTVHTGERGLPKSVPPIIEEDGPVKKYLVSAESPDKLKKIMKKYEKSGIIFDPKNTVEDTAKLIFKMDSRNIDSIGYLRVAAKIAFERLCGYSPGRAFNTDYDKVKRFIRYGVYQGSIPASLIYEDALIKEILPLRFPYHSIMLFGYGEIVASIISIFGLYYYFVLLDRENKFIGEWANYIYIDPQTRKARQPVLAHGYSLARILSLIDSSLRDPAVLRKAQDYSREIFDRAISKIRIRRSSIEIGSPEEDRR